MNVKYIVELTEDERAELHEFVGSGSRLVRKVKRAQVLLATDEGHADTDIASMVCAGTSTVYRAKRRFAEGNLERALNDDPRHGGSRKLTGKEEALLIATACSKPPAGRAKWTMELLADALVQLTDHTSLSRETVRRRLAENKRKMWCVPSVDALTSTTPRPRGSEWCSTTCRSRWQTPWPTTSTLRKPLSPPT